MHIVDSVHIEDFVHIADLDSRIEAVQEHQVEYIDLQIDPLREMDSSRKKDFDLTCHCFFPSSCFRFIFT